MTQLCPDKTEWLNFVTGHVEPAGIDALAAHLDDCAACQATVRQAHAGDDTLLALLKRSPVAGPYDDEPQLRQALEHLADSPGNADDLRTLNDPALDDARQRDNNMPSAGSAPRTRRFGPYEIIEELGRGGMGVVHKALQTHLDRLVAIKILPGGRLRDPAAVARFKREMKAVAKLDHPNIVRAYDGGEIEGEHYLAIEYLEGVDLSRLVAAALVLLAAIVIIIKDRHGKELARVEAPDAAAATIEVKPLAAPKPAGPKQPSSDSAANKPPPAKPAPPPAIATDAIGPGGLAPRPTPIEGLNGWNLVTRDPPGFYLYFLLFFLTSSA